MYVPAIFLNSSDQYEHFELVDCSTGPPLTRRVPLNFEAAPKDVGYAKAPVAEARFGLPTDFRLAPDKSASTDLLIYRPLV